MPSQSKKPIILVDGSSYLYRAFHIPNLQRLTNPAGQPTGAIYGVINMLRSLIREFQPDSLVVVFDAKGKTFRDELYEEYKANRPSMPDDMRVQIEPLHAIIKALGLPMLIEPGVEADDVIGTLAAQASAKGLTTVISTGDKDMAQLVNQHVTLINTMTNTTMDEAGVVEKFGVRPDQIIDYLALVGDTSDNIPGVPSCGPKTAVKWLAAHNDLETVMAEADSVKGKIGEKLRASLDFLPLSQTLTTIKTDVSLEASIEQLTIEPHNSDVLAEIYETQGFRTWSREIASGKGSVADIASMASGAGADSDKNGEGEETAVASELHTNYENMGTIIVPMAFFLGIEMVMLKNYYKRQKDAVHVRLKNQSLISELKGKNSNLARAQREAQQAATAKSEFLARMSHEVRTPINGVSGGADMLTRTELTADQLGWVNTIRSSSEDILVLINELLDHTHINNNELELNQHTFQLEACLQNSMSRLEEAHPDAALSIQFSENVPDTIFSDSLRVTQVLEHLVDNACKFSQNGEVNVVVDLTTDVAINKTNTETLRIKVTDDGIGIPVDKRESIFADLEQIDGGMSRQFGGMGIGLTLSKQLVTLLGGMLTVDSDEGRGSTFTVLLPLHSVGDSPQASGTQSSLAGLRVLVAEDNLVNQLMLEAMLEQLDCVVTLAEDGHEALEAMKEHDFDMVFMDCQMPRMSGLEATAAARDQGVEAPIVAVTANTEAGDRERCLKSGMNDYVTKPVNQQTIASILERYTSGLESDSMAVTA